MGRGELEYQLAWARTYLKNYGVIKSIKRGMWEVEPQYIGDTQLNYKEVVAFTANKNADSKNFKTCSTNENIESETEDSKYISDVEQPNSADLYIKSLIDLWKTQDLKIPFFKENLFGL